MKAAQRCNASLAIYRFLADGQDEYASSLLYGFSPDTNVAHVAHYYQPRADQCHMHRIGIVSISLLVMEVSLIAVLLHIITIRSHNGYMALTSIWVWSFPDRRKMSADGGAMSFAVTSPTTV
jgi:hypothetical protein